MPSPSTGGSGAQTSSTPLPLLSASFVVLPKTPLGTFTGTVKLSKKPGTSLGPTSGVTWRLVQGPPSCSSLPPPPIKQLEHVFSISRFGISGLTTSSLCHRLLPRTTRLKGLSPSLLEEPRLITTISRRPRLLGLQKPPPLMLLLRTPTAQPSATLAPVVGALLSSRARSTFLTIPSLSVSGTTIKARWAPSSG